MESNKHKDENMWEEKPPFLSSWKRLYSIVFLNLVILVLLFYLFTKIFS